jgi:hypothetical protein
MSAERQRLLDLIEWIETKPEHATSASFPALSLAQLATDLKFALSAHPDTGKEDGERLDWLEENVTVAARYRNQRPASDHDGPSFWSFNWSQWRNNESNSLSIRDAIDAARAAQSAPNEGRKS